MHKLDETHEPEDETPNERMNVELFGKLIGTADDWDIVDGLSALFYNFTPNYSLPNFVIQNIPPTCDLTIDVKKGLFIHNDEGKIVKSWKVDTLIFSET